MGRHYKRCRGNNLLAIKKNEDGLIYAYAEYRVVDKDAKDDKNGEYAYIRDCWIHPKYRKETLKELIKISHKKFPKLKWIYYKRSKYGGRIKLCPIERMYAEKK
jgi:hypothetical protein